MNYRCNCDEQQLIGLAATIAQSASVGSVIYLQGDLGAGKTTFCRAFIEALGFDGVIQSPTYTWMQVYEFAGKRVLHLDMYLSQQKHIDVHGLLADYSQQDAIILVEWAELVDDLPPSDLRVNISGDGSSRAIDIDSSTELGDNILLKRQDADAV
jgi:tRNA threonylcarbamoyladenosine biosynthesis protein TsaE